jgi:glycogen synthase
VHVLITADTVGGVWTYTRELVCGLLGGGHRVTLVSFGRMPTPAQSSWIGHDNLSYLPTAYPLEWMQNSERGIEESKKFLEGVIRDCRPDLLHFNQYCYSESDYGLPAVVVAHSDVLSWWRSVHESNPPQSAWFHWYGDLVSKGLGNAGMVVAPSQWMLDALQEQYAFTSPCRVVYNGRSECTFASSPTKTDCVLSVGRLWDEAKQIKLLLARKHRVPVQVAGSAEHPENLSCVELQTDANVKLCGEQDETQLRALYSDSASYAATSRYEPFGLAPLEAALSRCALIANDIPVFHELWGDAALYFKRNDPDGLADAICTVFDNPRLRQDLADQAYERARANFNSQRMVMQYEELYSELLGKGASA